MQCTEHYLYNIKHDLEKKNYFKKKLRNFINFYKRTGAKKLKKLQYQVHKLKVEKQFLFEFSYKTN